MWIFSRRVPRVRKLTLLAFERRAKEGNLAVQIANAKSVQRLTLSNENLLVTYAATALVNEISSRKTCSWIWTDLDSILTSMLSTHPQY